MTRAMLAALCAALALSGCVCSGCTYIVVEAGGDSLIETLADTTAETRQDGRLDLDITPVP